MNRKITLTTQEKTMNMAKLGIVSRLKDSQQSGAISRKQRNYGLMRYTLCVFHGKARRNGSRYGFAFDVPAISGLSPFSGGKLTELAGQVAVLVPLQLILISENYRYHKQTQLNPDGLRLPRRFLRHKNYSALRDGFSGGFYGAGIALFCPVYLRSFGRPS